MNYKAEEYYNKIGNSKVICVDFDNTICLDEWPYIGPIIPGAFEVLNALQKAGHKLILFTQRNYKYPVCCKSLFDIYTDPTYNGTRYLNGNPISINYLKNINFHTLDYSEIDLIEPVIKLCEDNGIKFYSVNENPLWDKIIDDHSRKIYMDYTIDDHAVGIKKLPVVNKFGEKCQIVDWFELDRWCMNECLYKDSAFKYGYHDYLKEINNIAK